MSARRNNTVRKAHLTSAERAMLASIKESPEARRERLRSGNRAVATRVESGKHKQRGGRSGAKRAAIAAY